MTDEIKKITIKLGPCSAEQAADDLEAIARSLRSGVIYVAPPHLAYNAVDVKYPDPPKDEEEVEEVLEEPEVKPAAKAKK